MVAKTFRKKLPAGSQDKYEFVTVQDWKEKVITKEVKPVVKEVSKPVVKEALPVADKLKFAKNKPKKKEFSKK